MLSGHEWIQPALLGIGLGGAQAGHSPVCNKMPLRTFGIRNLALPYRAIVNQNLKNSQIGKKEQKNLEAKNSAVDGVWPVELRVVFGCIEIKLNQPRGCIAIR